MSNLNVLHNKLKIVLLGKSGVGKTNLITRFLADVLNDSETSMDVSIFAPKVRLSAKNCAKNL